MKQGRHLPRDDAELGWRCGKRPAAPVTTNERRPAAEARLRAEIDRARAALTEARGRSAGPTELRLLRDRLSALLARLRALRGRDSEPG